MVGEGTTLSVGDGVGVDVTEPATVAVLVGGVPVSVAVGVVGIEVSVAVLVGGTGGVSVATAIGVSVAVVDDPGDVVTVVGTAVDPRGAPSATHRSNRCTSCGATRRAPAKFPWPASGSHGGIVRLLRTVEIRRARDFTSS